MHRHIFTIAILSLLNLAGFASAANISSTLEVLPNSSATDESTIHSIRWNTNTPGASVVNAKARFVVYYPNNFDLSQLSIADTYDYTTMNGGMLIDSIDTVDPNWQKIYLTRKDADQNGVGLVGIKLAMIKNPDPGTYPMQLKIYPAGTSFPDQVAATDSGTANIVITQRITNFTFTYDEPDNPKAGQPFTLKVTNAVDAQNNPADGIVKISFDDGNFNNHIAPDGTEPVLVAIPVQNGTGEADQILYLDEAGYVQLRGTVDGGSFYKTLSNNSGNGLNVFPGALGRFELTGYPATAVAGLNFSPNNVTVTAYDKWDNLKTDYRGQVYFDSDTDPSAYFDYNGIGSPDYYTFTDVDNGSHSFNNDSFSFRTSGTQTFKVLNQQQTISETSGPIVVSSGAIVSFNFNIVAPQKAGRAFQLGVSEARDSGGNLASGTITVAFASGTLNDHAAQNGQLPILNNITVQNGIGSASQFLVKAEQNVQFRGTVSGSSPAITQTTNPFNVTPGDLAAFTINTPVQAQIGQAFTSDVVVKAYDGFGSLKTDFLGTVTFNDYNNQDPGAVLPSPYTFTVGDAGSHTFAQSQFILNTQGDIRLEISSGSITEVSDPIKVTGVNSIVLGSISTANEFVSRGQKGINVSMQVINNGTEIFTYSSANLIFRDSLGTDVSTDYVVPSVGSAQIPAGTTITIPFTVDVNSNARLGDIDIDGSIVGTYPSGASQATANATDTWQVQRPAAIDIVSTTMDATIPRGSSPNPITVRVANNSGLTLSADAIVNTINFTFTDETLANVTTEFPVTPVSVFPATIAGGGTADFTFNMQSKATAPDGIITVGVAANYEDANSAKTGTVSNNAATTFESIKPGEIKIVSIDPEQSTVTQGQTNIDVDMTVENLGSNDAIISPNWADTFIEFKRGNTTYISSETNQGDVQGPSAPVTILPGEQGIVRFRITQVQNTVPAGNLQIYATATTTNGISSSSEDDNVYGELIVQRPEVITINQVLPSRETVTVDDDTTPWEVKVVVKNSGGSNVFFDLAGSSLAFTPNSGFTVGIPSVSDDNTLTAGEEDTLTFPITQNGSTPGTVTIGANIQYQVINTNETKTSSGGATGSVLLQSEANVVIVRTKSSLPSVTQNTSPNWTVSVVVQNQGDADVNIDFADAANTWLRFYRQSIWITNFDISRPTKLAGTGGALLEGGKTDSLIFVINSNTADPGTYSIEAAVKNTEINRQLDFFTLTTAQTSIGTVDITEQASLAYKANSINPTVVSPGRLWTFSIVVQNNSAAMVDLADNSTFTLTDGVAVYTAELSPSSPTTIQANDSLEISFENYMAPSFPFGSYVPEVHLSYLDNNLPAETDLNMYGETVVVGEGGAFVVTSLLPSVKTVTKGQKRDWTIRVGLKNSSAQLLNFKDVKLDFFLGGTTPVTDKFDLDPISTTLENGRTYLQPNEESAVIVTVTEVHPSAPAGDVVISAQATMADNQGGGDIFASLNNQGPVTVQTEALLSIESFRPSQKSVTKGQTQSWFVGARIKNNGGSAVEIDQTAMNLDIVSVGNAFTFTVPTVFVNSGSDTLFGGQEDSVYFEITQVADTLSATVPGDSIRLVGYIGTTELNTGNAKVPNTVSNPIRLAVNDSAQVRIEKFEAMIESPGQTVNAGSEFYVRAQIKNSGGTVADHLNKATVRISTNSPGYFFEGGAQSDTASVFNLAPGDTAWTAPIKVITPANIGRQGQFPIEVDMTHTAARNAKDLFEVDPSDVDIVVVETEAPAVFAIDSITPSETQLAAGRSLPWSIFVNVSNNGDGLVELYDPQTTDVVITNNLGQPVDPRDYTLRVITPSNKVLGNGSTAIIQFEVLSTWDATGDFRINVTVRAKELNNILQDLEPTSFTMVSVSNEAEILVQETDADTSKIYARVDAKGVVHVNTGQQFKVNTEIFNSSSTWIDTVRVSLISVNSSVTPAFREITLLDRKSAQTDSFLVTADATENLLGEKLQATITKAVAGGGGSVTVREAVDDSVIIKIYEPAKLQVVSTENLAPNAPNISLGHNFNVRVVVKNEGSEPARNVGARLEAGTAGLVTIESPGYKFLSEDLAGGASDTLIFVVNAGNTAGLLDLRSSIIQGIGINDRNAAEILTSIDSTAAADLKPGAKLVVNSVVPSEPIVTAGDQTPWRLAVGISNTGQADLKLVGVTDTTVTFSQNGIEDTEYRVIAPTELDFAGNFILQAGASDTLSYVVRRNGQLLNQVDIDVLLKAVDLNTDQTKLLSDSGHATIEVSSNAAVGLARTTAVTNVYDKNGLGLVNYGQNFEVEAKVQTGQFGGVDNVIVKLTTNGNSFVGALYDTISTINRDTTVSALFKITADASWNFDLGEISEDFTAEVVSAVAKGDTTPVIPRTPLPGDDIANVRIQTPAQLSYFLQVGEKGGALVQQSEIFDVFVKMQNLGRSPIGTGKIKLEPPFGGYKVKNQVGDFIDFPLEKQFTWPVDQDTLDVIFTMMAPDSASGPDSIRTFLSGRPVDRNTDSSLVALGPIDSFVVVNTVDDLLKIESFTIIEPVGAIDGTLSTDQFFTLQAVIKSAQNLQDRQAVLEAPPGQLGYDIQSPDKVNITTELDTITWTIQAPNTIIGDAHEFSLTVTGGVFGEDFATAKETVEITSVEKKTSLSLQKIAFDPAGVLKNDAMVTFSTDQTAKIIARIENDGADYEGTGYLEVVGLSNSNLQLLDGTERVNFQVGFDVEWNILAPPLSVTDGKELTVRVIADSIRDINSGEPVTVAPTSQTLTVFVNEGGRIEVTDLAFWPEDVDVEIDSVSSDQNFRVTARIFTDGVKETDITAQLKSENDVFKPLDGVKNIASSGEKFVTWIVRAPNHQGNFADSIHVFVNAIDLQSNQPLPSQKSKGVFVPIAERTTFEFKPFISDPIELRNDDRISTGQHFSITADIEKTGADFHDDGVFELRLYDPSGEGFELAEGESWVKTIQASDFKNSGTLPTWRLKAPETKLENLSDFIIRVQKMPNDMFSYQEATAVNRDVIFSVRTLEKAQVYFDGYLHGEPNNLEATVRSGNEFEVTAALNNEGEAGLSGSFSAELLLPDGFEFVDSDSIKTDLADSVNTVSWMVRAPKELHAVPDTFWIALLQKPKDKLAQTEAEMLSSDTTFVLVHLEKGAIIVSDYDVRSSTAVIRGRDDVPIMGLKLRNKDASGNTESYIHGIRFFVRDKTGNFVSPGSIVSRIAAVRDDGAVIDTTHVDHIFAEQSVFGDSGIVYLDFYQGVGGQVDTLKGNVTDNIKLVVDIKPDAEMKDFRFIVDSLTAIDEFDIPLIIADSTEAEIDSLRLSSIMAVMVDEDLDKSFFNYPNPFGRGGEYQNTYFTYYLKEASDVKIHIYTLTGDLVRTWDIKQAENEEWTSEGLHQGQLVWDGKNGMGHDVLNGVYLAYILTGYGEQSMTKIAVIR